MAHPQPEVLQWAASHLDKIEFGLEWQASDLSAIKTDPSLEWEASFLDNIIVPRVVVDETYIPYNHPTMVNARRNYPHMHPEHALTKYAIENWVEEIYFKYNKALCTLRNLRASSKDCTSTVQVDGEVCTFSHLRLKKDIPIEDYVHKTDIDWLPFKKRTSFHPYESAEDANRHWNLPSDHPRHLFNFPKDILVKILRYLVTAPDYTIIPMPITSNETLFYNEGDYSCRTRNHNAYFFVWKYNDEVLVKIPTKSYLGPATEFCIVSRPNIDSSILRTSRVFADIGADILYGNNEFEFGMFVTSRSGRPATFANDEFHRPEVVRPVFDPENPDLWFKQIYQAISCIRNRVDIHNLPGWLYYDLFLRFLHTIGPKNTTLLNALRFTGRIKSHSCTREPLICAGHCDEDLLSSMRIYIPVINALCPGVKKVTLVSWIDRQISVKEERLKMYKESLQVFLEEDFRTLENVNKVEVYGCTDLEDIQSWREMEDWEIESPIRLPQEMLDLAKPTIHWFHDRAKLNR